MIKLVTTNFGKISEFREVIPEIEGWFPTKRSWTTDNTAFIPVDIPEIQSLDGMEVIRRKLDDLVPYFNRNDEYVVEDTTLHLSCLNGFPGPMTKFMIQAIGPEGLFELAYRYDNYTCWARTYIGYYHYGVTKFWFGEVYGTITQPKTEPYGWDSIFIPKGYNHTYGQLGRAEKVKDSMRTRAILQMQRYRDGKNGMGNSM